MIGMLAAAILIVNVNLPNVIEMLCSVAIVWANLAYLMVTLPLLAVAAQSAAPLDRPRPVHEAPSRNERAAAGGQASLLLAGSLGPSGERGRGCLGVLRRHQYRLAAHRDLRRPSLGPLRRAAGDPRA